MLGSYVDDLSSAIRKKMELQASSKIMDRLQSVLAGLVALAIGQRDMLTEFINNNITDVNSFEWITQLRHRIEINTLIGSPYQGETNSTSSRIPISRTYEIGLCTVQQLGSRFVYGYEYLGPTPRLVMTPLTHRCFLALTTALRAHYCGVPVGLDGIGKTETVRDLSKAFGRHLVMFNCSEQLQSSLLVRYLRGMVCSGSWACFENVDCLGSSVLSILGEHLSTIVTSLKCLKKFELSQYTARGISKTDTRRDKVTKRRNSVVTLTPLPKEAFSPNHILDSDLGDHLPQRKRHLSVSRDSDLQDGDYYHSDSQLEASSLESQQKLPDTFQNTATMEHKRHPSCSEFQMPLLGSIVFEGQLLPASAFYGCFMTMSGTCSTMGNLPDNFRAHLRPVSMLFPDGRPVVEVWLVCCGFTEAKALALKIDIFFKLISQQLSQQTQYSFGLRSMKMVTHLAGRQLEKDMAKKRNTTAMTSVMEEPISESKDDTVPEANTRSSFIESLERRQSEENAVVHALFTYFGNKLLLDDKPLFSRAVDEVFAHSVLMSVSMEGDPQLVEEIKEQLRANGLQVKPEVVSKIVQLHTSMQTNHNVILVGCPGSGKTTLYTILASVMSKMNGETAPPVVKTRRPTFAEKKTSTFKLTKASVAEVKEGFCPRVDLSVVFPKSLTCEELFGSLHSESGVWIDGLVSKWLRDATLTCDTMTELLTSQSSDKQRFARMMGSLCHVKKWIVLDGPMDDTWLESMGTLLDSTRALNLANGETISQPETVSLLFEVTELQHVSPALVTRCGVVHCPESTVGWKVIFKSWMKGAHARWEITNRGLGILSCLMDHAVDSTLKFLDEHCQTVLTEGYSPPRAPSKTASGIYEVQTLLRFLSAIFDRHILREDEDSAMQMIGLKQGQSVSSISSRHSSGISASDSGRVTSSFAFAFVWAFGGHLHERYASKFNEYARQLLSSGPYPVLVPPEGSVYDYCLDFSKGGLVKWDERPAAIQRKTLPSSYTVLTELDRYFYLIDLMLSTRQPVLLVGESGVGKSSLVRNLVNPRYSPTRVCLSPGLTSRLLREAIEHKLQQMQRKELNQMAVQKSLGNAPTRALAGSKTASQLFFLDDLNCASADSFGIQSPLELLRQILSQGTMYDKQRYHFYSVQNVHFMAACVPPGAATSGGGVASYPVCPRLSRLMTVLSFFPLSSDSLRSIYRSVFVTWLEEFPTYSVTHHEQLGKALSSATVKMYNVIRQELRPTPLHPHYLFTQHELSRVVQGMSLLSSKSRGRPRPRARRRTEPGREVERETKLGPILARSVDLYIQGGEKWQSKEEQVWKGRSWPSLTSGPRESAMSVNTPAAMSPMIRSLLRLWCHETTRTYSDRLFSQEQRLWFSSLLRETVEEFFCSDSSEAEMEIVGEEQEDLPKNTSEISSGTNAPPLSAMTEKPDHGEESDDINGGHVQDVDASGGEDEDASKELGDEGLIDGAGADIGDEQVEEVDEQMSEIEEDKFEVEDDQDISREDTSLESTTGGRFGRNKVTFDDRNIASLDVKYTGPLILFEQLAFSGEDLTDIVFCKHFNASVTGLESNASEMATKNYLECADSILEQGINRCLASYNSQVAESSSGRIMNLVTFREALRHATRLSRALATPGGHALLLSSLGYGRRSLTKVTAHAACYKFIEVQRSQFQSKEDLRQQIKLASFIAGLQGKSVVLFVPEGVDDESMQDICSFMSEGTCPGLYTQNELSLISSQLLPGGKRGARRAESQDIAQDRYFRRVKSNLHVVVCLKYTPLHLSASPDKNQLYKFPALVTRSCCVDIYRAWPHKALISVAEKVLEKEESVLNLLPLKRRERDMQSSTICSVMAQVHLSSRTMVEKVYGSRALKFYSPDTYLDFIDLFRKICIRLCVKEKEEAAHLEKAIKRMDEATNSLNKMQRELDQLSPVFEASRTDVQVSQETVEACQKEYTSAKEKCKKQELDIELMQGPIEILKKAAQAEFEKVNPLFDAAWRAIDSLNIYDVEEIRSYRTPPNLVRLVVNAVCLLFEKEQTWEEGKLLLNRLNFFKDLEFYNMKNIPDSIFNGLQLFYDDPKFRPEVVQEGSVAAKSLCMWVRAVYEFCLVYRALEPKRLQLAKAEAELEKAKSILGEMRVRCNAVKQELESSIQLYKDSVKHSRSVEKQIQSLDAIRAKGVALVESLSSYTSTWHSNRSSTKQRLLTAPGDALVTAAAVCYLGPLQPDARQELFSDWLKACDGITRKPKQRLLSLSSVILRDTRNKNATGNSGISRPTTQSALESTDTTGKLPLRKDVSLESILSCPNEIDDWRRRDLPSDQQSLQNALILRSCGDDRTRAWPLLVDPHNQAELWIAALHQVDLDTSRSETRLSDRSPSRHSRRSSVELEAAVLGDSHSGQSAADDSEHDPHLSDNEVDQFLESLKEPEEHGGNFLESVTPATATRTERPLLSTLTTTSEKLAVEKLAEVMGVRNTNSPPPIQFISTPVMNLAEQNLLIVQADDPQIVNKLHAAVKKGLVTLVTHVERRRWEKSLELLLLRQTFTNADGMTQVFIGNTAVNYHPSFRLYVSSSFPLFTPGEGQYPLPFSKVSTLSLSLSRDGLRDMLLLETLRLERPEFDSPLRSAERDISLHNQQIAQAKESVLRKVVALSSPLLKDSSMKAVVIQSKETISTAEERRQEAEKMKTELLLKQNHFLPVAKHGALLFVVMSQLQELHPYYCFPLHSFVQLYHDTISERNRGKKSSGSPAARSAELMSALSKKIFERTSWTLFQADNHFFPFLLAMEKLLNSGSVSRDEWLIFSRMPTEFPANHLEESDSPIPHWLPRRAWLAIDELEVLPAFKGLKNSVANQSEQWREYFNLPAVLLGLTPGDFSHLTVFQKALLWKTFQPGQLFRVCHDIVLYQVGASMTRSIGYDLEQLYPFTSQSRPVVFLLPSLAILEQGEASVLKDPVTDVINLARARGKDGSLLMVTLGDTASLEKALICVKEGTKTGCWVVLENCHLANNWSKEFVQQLHTIMTMTETIPNHELERQYTEGSLQEKPEIIEAEDDLVHPEFRLWLTTKTNVGLPLPAILIQNGIKVACEAKENFRDSVRTNFHVVSGSLNNCTPVWGTAAESSVYKSDIQLYAIYKLAYLHSSLLQRRKYGQMAFSCPYKWFHADLLAGLHALCDMSRASHASVPIAAVEEMLGYVVYGGHAINGLDLNAVKSIASSIFVDRVGMDSTQEDIKLEQIDTLIANLPEAPPCKQFALTDPSDAIYQSKLSSLIADRLATCTGNPMAPISFESYATSIAEETMDEISVIIQAIRSHDLAQDANTAVASFIQRELVFLLRLLEEAGKDLVHLNDACSGNIAFTPDLFNLALSLRHRQAPSEWLVKRSVRISLAVWLENIGIQFKLLTGYHSCSPLLPASFSLGAFFHPQAFLACVLMDHARSTMKSVYGLEFAVEVLNQETDCTSPPSRGIYLSGLKLNGASWDTERGCISRLTDSRDPCELPIVWLKPVEVMRSRATSAKAKKHDDDINSFDCPLLTGEDWRTDLCTLLTNLSLPSIVAEAVLKQRRVAILSTLQ
ncbi:LOW QUALITY PROTEIN: dynein heavy chain domain-containing protein 1-like [Acropora millepora]|uniref:LOW QUALITY PROTEIN: dynein heavy chain domain-containing protein 1-like n=1 Tax=Acropora millepora TaxID=45264 RepID=UPI001CF5FD4D|nr:LOW QUALITY PROTEIN: dynein heavy chain domain-containing protein 1-like [Acropora millepora]